MWKGVAMSKEQEKVIFKKKKRERAKPNERD